jgi:hypothetical protein
VGIEWFRDLSIVILALVTSAVFIFAAVLVYRLYRITKSVLLLVKAVSKIVYDTAGLVQESLKPLLTILALIKGISGGFQSISKIFKQENNE